MAQLAGSAGVPSGAGIAQVRGRHIHPGTESSLSALVQGWDPGVCSMAERKGSHKDEESRKYLLAKLAWKGLEG